MAPLCVCYQCGGKMDCDPGGMCEVCEEYVEALAEPSKPHHQTLKLEPGDRQILNILQRLHRSMLQETQPYVSYTKECRWKFSEGVYGCDHVSIREEDVMDSYKRQMEK